MDDRVLASILKAAIGTTASVSVTQVPGGVRHFRSYASAGALYPCSVYVVRPDKPAALYDPVDHVLRMATDETVNFSALEAGRWAAPACVFIIVADLSLIQDKYGPRGYRFALLEAGAIGQNLCLAATALSCPSLVYGSYFDAEIERVLGFDGLSRVVLSTVLAGAPTSNPGD